MKLFRRNSIKKAALLAGDEDMGINRDELDRAEGLTDATTLESLGLMKALVIYRQQPIGAELSVIGRRYSMLHLDVLILLYYLAGHLAGDILEIGPYIGGSTIATAKGVQDAGRDAVFVTVENGGSYNHATLSSSDIIADLRSNIANSGVSDLVHVIEGSAGTGAIAEKVRKKLLPGNIGLLVMDADGAIKETIATYRNLLRPGCWFVIDDYCTNSDVARNKAEQTREEVDSLVSDGELEALGIFGWGTWIGRRHFA